MAPYRYGIAKLNLNSIVFAGILMTLLFISAAFAQVPTAGLKVWLKAGAGVTTTATGDSVTSWADQSGNGNNATQTTAGDEPVYVANAIGGQPALQFNGSTSFLTLPKASTIGILNSNYEIFIVAKTSSSAIQFLIAGATEQFEVHLNAPAAGTASVAGVRFIPTASEYIDEGSPTQYADGSPHIFDASASTTNGIIRVDGVEGGDSTGNMQGSTDSTIYLGCRSSKVLFLDGDIAEVLIYNTVLSNADRVLVESYLASKYGIKYSDYVVSSTSDADSGSYNTGTLRYVINRVDSIGSSDTADVDMTDISGTITLTSALPPINYSATLDGPGAAGLTVSGDNLYRPFFIGSALSPFSTSSPASPTVDMKGFTISQGLGQGGNGAPGGSNYYGGGGGAAGMGGAIFVNAGTLFVDSMSFSENTAAGGNGTITNNANGGGGGGFAGDGSGLSGGSGGDIGSDGVGGAGNNNFGNGGSGVFGGGGGAPEYDAGIAFSGGTGGFGGGGGESFGTAGGGSTFGGGTGGEATQSIITAYGGGGAGMGGAIFNRNGNIILENSSFVNDSTSGGTGNQSGGTYGGAIFNYGGTYYLKNVTYGTNADTNYATSSPNMYIYSGNATVPTAELLPVTNLTESSATISGTVKTNSVSTTYKFVYGTVPNSLSDTLAQASAGSSGTDTVSANLTGLSYGTFYYFRLLASNTYGNDTSSLGAFIYDTTLSKTHMKLWLSAGKGVDTTTGGAVSEWFDISGNNNSASQSTPADMPSLVAGAINGHHAVSFNGSSSYLILPSATDLGLQNSDYEMFVVALDTSSATQFILGGYPTSNYELQLNGGLGARFIPEGTTYLDEGNPGAFTNGQAHVFDVKASTTEGIIHVDGVAGGYTQTDVQSSASGALNIGRRSSGALYLGGDVAEVLIYDTTLTSAQRLAVTDYLSQRYNISYTTVSTPTVQASNMTFSNVSSSSLTLKVTKGNGAYRIIIGKQGSAVDSLPGNGSVYTADSVFGSGSEIGTGNYVVYAGSDSVITVTGLLPNTDYYFSAFEYNGTNTDQTYLTTSPATGNQATTVESPTVALLSDSTAGTTALYFRGTVNPNGDSTTCKFAYGTNPDSLTDTTASLKAGSGSSSDTVRVEATGLASGTVYYQKLIASNGGGTTTSSVSGAVINNSIPASHLRMWLRADEATSSSVDSSSVATWYDVSGNANNATQSSSGNQPILITNAVNGYPVLTFNGSSSFFNLPSSGSLGIKNSDYEIFIVARSSYTAQPEFVLSGDYQFEVQLNGTFGVRFIPNTTTNYYDEGTANEYSNGVPHIFGFTAGTSGGGVTVDDTTGATTTTSLIDTNNVAIVLGERVGAIYHFDGDIAEMIVYNTILDSAQQNEVDSYLAKKYNITTSDISLNVAATAFEATPAVGSVDLSWMTRSEVDNAGFDILRSSESITGSDTTFGPFKLIASYTTDDSLRGLGTSSTGRQYHFTDDHVLSGATYRYKIESVNTQSMAASNLMTLTVTVNVPRSYALYQNYPNPFNPSTTIRFDLMEQSNVTLAVYNVLGQRVEYWNYGMMGAGRYNESINMDRFASGVYFYRLVAEGKDGARFVAIKKLMLLK